MPSAVMPLRGDPDTWYPAGHPDVTARWLTLPGGERVRVVEPAEERRSYVADALLLHGWGCNAFHFRRLVPALARHGIRAFALDLRGHGLSNKPPDPASYTSSALADFAQRALDALQLQQAGIVGHSLGGAIALDTAAAAPARVAWLALLSPIGLSRLAYAPVFTRLPTRHADHIPAAVSRAVAYVALHLAYGRRARPDRGDLEQYLFPTLEPGGRLGMLAYAQSFSWAPRASSLLQRISSPMRVMFGERDRVIRHREAAERLSAIPHARWVVVPDAGHVLAEEVPDYVAEAVAQLAKPDGT